MTGTYIFAYTVDWASNNPWPRSAHNAESDSLPEASSEAGARKVTGGEEHDSEQDDHLLKNFQGARKVTRGEEHDSEQDPLFKNLVASGRVPGGTAFLRELDAVATKISIGSRVLHVDRNGNHTHNIRYIIH